MHKSLFATTTAIILSLGLFGAGAALADRPEPGPDQDGMAYCILYDGEETPQPEGNGLYLCQFEDADLWCDADWTNCELVSHQAADPGNFEISVPITGTIAEPRTGRSLPATTVPNLAQQLIQP